MLESVIASPEVVHYICKRFDIKMSKKLGQNFLIKRGIVDEIVHAAELTPGEPVLEVGPGIGTLTQGLAQSGADVTAIELDRRLLEVLDTTLASYDNVRIVHGDVLKLDVPTIMNHKPFKVVANLPYYITTPIIMSLLESKLPIERLVVMVQKEVACAWWQSLVQRTMVHCLWLFSIILSQILFLMYRLNPSYQLLR